MSDLNLYPDSNLLTLTMQNVPTTIVLKKCPDKYSYTDTQYPRIKRVYCQCILNSNKVIKSKHNGVTATETLFIRFNDSVYRLF